MTSGADRVWWFWAGWLAAVVFVFPIPHTIALRNLLLGLGLLVLLWTGRKSLPAAPPWSKSAGAWLAALTAWIVFHSVALAPVTGTALDEFRANWLVPLLIGAIGAWAATRVAAERILQALVLALAAHMLWLLAWQAKIFLTAKSWPFKITPFGSYDFQGTLDSFLLALLVADRLVWVLRRHSPLALGPRAGYVLLVLALVSDVALQSRNTTIVSLALLLTAGITLLKAGYRPGRFVLWALCVIALLGAGSLSFDQRWQGLRESVTVGWTSNSTYWMTNDGATRPATASGAVLEESAYARAAWVRQAIGLIGEHPLGVGFGHDAFGRAVQIKYGHAGMGSSHSGWLDFALGTGLPGLALLLSVAGAALHSGWREFRERQDAVALLLAMFIGGYLLRCLLDGHLSGWRLSLFALITGVLVGSMRKAPAAP